VLQDGNKERQGRIVAGGWEERGFWEAQRMTKIGGKCMKIRKEFFMCSRERLDYIIEHPLPLPHRPETWETHPLMKWRGRVLVVLQPWQGQSVITPWSLILTSTI
jgi:hypothetical protein